MCIIFSVKMTNINIPNNQKDMLEKKLKQYQFYQIKLKKKESDHATDVTTSALAAKKFYCLEK